MPYSLVYGYRHIGVFCCLHVQGRPAPLALKRESRKKGKTRKDGKIGYEKKNRFQSWRYSFPETFHGEVW